MKFQAQPQEEDPEWQPRDLPRGCPALQPRPCKEMRGRSKPKDLGVPPASLEVTSHRGSVSTVTQAALARKSEGTLHFRHPAAEVTALHGSGDQALGPAALWGAGCSEHPPGTPPRGHVCGSSKDPLLPTCHPSQETGCYLLTNELFFLLRDRPTESNTWKKLEVMTIFCL